MKSNYNTYPLALIAGMIIINGCNPEIIPLKGKYETGVSEITSTKPIDSVWVDITSLFLAPGVVIKTLDKEKG